MTDDHPDDLASVSDSIDSILADESPSLAELQFAAWHIAEDSGFHTGRARATVLALIHSEVSEALEADRDPDVSHDAYATELADILIRVLDHAETEGIELSHYVRAKMRENAGRDHKHGKHY